MGILSRAVTWSNILEGSLWIMGTGVGVGRPVTLWQLSRGGTVVAETRLMAVEVVRSGGLR